VPFRHNSIPLFGGGDPPSGLRLRNGVGRKDPDDDGGP